MLLDPVRRTWYDRYGQDWQHYQGAATPVAKYHDTQATTRDGYDVEYTATITFAEARGAPTTRCDFTLRMDARMSSTCPSQ